MSKISFPLYAEHFFEAVSEIVPAILDVASYNEATEETLVESLKGSCARFRDSGGEKYTRKEIEEHVRAEAQKLKDMRPNGWGDNQYAPDEKTQAYVAQLKEKLCELYG